LRGEDKLIVGSSFGRGVATVLNRILFFFLLLTTKGTKV
jgi:hypothetical protein